MARRLSRRRRLGLVALAVLVAGLAGWDLARPPDRQLSARGLLASIDAYQATLSPLLGRSGVRCRFEPSCSHYAEAVIRRHGTLGGLRRTIWRLLRCAPWTPQGTYDPPDGAPHPHE